MALVPGLGALRLAGGVLVGLGSLATMGATFVEFQTLKEKIEEAEKIMLQDREYSEKLWNWMSDGSHLQEAYNTITSIDVTWRKVAADLFDCFKMKRKHGAKTAHMKMIIEKVVKQIFPNCKADDIIQVIGILLAIYMLHERCRSLFNIAFETYRSKGILIAAREVAASAVKMAVVSAGQSSKLNPFQKGSRGIGIALDVINIIHASKDFDETSKESVAIAKAAKQLKEEADIFKKLYDAVTCA